MLLEAVRTMNQKILREPQGYRRREISTRQRNKQKHTDTLTLTLTHNEKKYTNIRNTQVRIQTNTHVTKL